MARLKFGVWDSSRLRIQSLGHLGLETSHPGAQDSTTALYIMVFGPKCLDI